MARAALALWLGLSSIAPAVAQTAPPGAAAPQAPMPQMPAQQMPTWPTPAPVPDRPAAPPSAQAPAGTTVTPPADGTATPEVALPPIGAPAGAVTLPRDLSPWGMFVHADIVVKSIMVGLVLASLVTWTIWLAKVFELRLAKRRVAAALRVLARARSTGEAAAQLQDDRNAGARLMKTAVAEMEVSPDAEPEALKERVSWLLTRVEAGASRQIGRGMGVLASVGAISPFVGLFGTVWGIMNSFIGISQANTTNLAVVAPGIAEALLATAIGLFAAIPAVVMYNGFARAIGGYRSHLADASALVMRLVSRDCDRGGRMASHMVRAAE